MRIPKLLPCLAFTIGLFAPAPLLAQEAEEGAQPGAEEAEDTKDAAKKKGADKAPGGAAEKAQPSAPGAVVGGFATSGPVTSAVETNCKDRIDEDGDSVVDCGDADCYDKPECKPTGVHEQTDALCSDWIDNDGDGSLDCDDKDCQTGVVAVCQGSWKGDERLVGAKAAPSFNVPLDEGMSVDELIGKFGDADGERNDYVCSDGVDNDKDGRTDCADFGCRFDPSVTICNVQPGFRFSVVAQLEQAYRIEDTNAQSLQQNDWDTRFSVLQLRFLGPIANLENSYFLVNMRGEKTPRVTFAMFQLPIGKLGHYFNLNSGGGGLTSQLIQSASKHLLLEPAFFAYSAFEQGNGAAIEVGGPIDSGGRVNFRTFAAGGSGTFSGNVGGRFFTDDNTNYTWSAGAQLAFNVVGYYNRFDSPYLVNPEPLKVAVLAGGKYEQRSQERYPAWNGTAVMKWWHFLVSAETYWKRELEFGSWQYSYLATVGALLWPRHLMLAAEFGEYVAGDLDEVPANINADVGEDIRKQRDERQFRAALHWYAYEQTGIVSMRYTYRDVMNGRFADDGFREQELSLFAGYRF